MNIDTVLKDTIQTLTDAGISTARLDALVLLADEYHKDKAWILAHLDESVTPKILSALQSKIALRAKRHPIAYIRGKQEFYGRDFIVNNHVLIPRPDSEALIDLLKELSKDKPGNMIDIGTGCGALGITAALECPHLEVWLNDIDPKALTVARSNAKHHKLEPQFYTGDLLEEFLKQPGHPTFTYIVANLPYVDRIWERSVETNYEPSLALFADDGGLELIKKLLTQAPNALTTDGYLLLEADPRQHKNICQFATTQGFTCIDQKEFTMVLRRSLKT